MNFKNDAQLHLINSNFVSSKDADILKNNTTLQVVLEKVIEKLKQEDEFFREFYQKIIFAGSFYKGTKVGKPEEFDLNIVIKLPLRYEAIEFKLNKPGFIQLKLNSNCYEIAWKRHEKILEKLVSSDGYLKPDELRNRMESIFCNIPQTVTIRNEKYELRVQKSGPAFTLWVKGPNKIEMSIDLVPVLEFNRLPPLFGDFGTESWFAVPKPHSNPSDTTPQWRMSFYQRERAILLKSCNHIKPVIRLLKKLRDTEDWKSLVSYHIEILVLRSMKTVEPQSALEKCSLTECFVYMLQQLKEACKNKNITSIWGDSHNLLLQSNREQLEMIGNRLEVILTKISRNPLAIADFILTKEERSNQLQATGMM